MFIGFLLLMLSSSSRNYQNYKTWRSQRDKEHKKLGSKPGQNPTRGKPQENPILTESDQSEISKIRDQDRDYHKYPSQPSSHPFPTNNVQQNSMLVKSQKSSHLLKFRACNTTKNNSENSHAWTETRAENRNFSPLTFAEILLLA